MNYLKSPTRSDDTGVSEDGLVGMKKSIDSDFRVKYKTEQCKFFALNKSCKYGDNCAFAHGNVDIKKRSNLTNNYKTKKCKQFYDVGYCPYGPRCQFLHNERKSSCTLPNIPSVMSAIISPKNINSSYKQTIASLSSFDTLPEQTKNTPFKRLLTFEKLTKNLIENDENKNTFHDDVSTVKKQLRKISLVSDNNIENIEKEHSIECLYLSPLQHRLMSV